MRQLLTASLLVLLTFWFTGCASTTSSGPQTDSQDAAQAGTSGVGSSPGDGSAMTEGAGSDAAESSLPPPVVRERDGPSTSAGEPLSQRVVYFGYDESTISDQDWPIIEAHGLYLSENPELTIMLSGHTDERGTREYNIGLGERRVQAVRRVMMLNGASSAQISVVSYGEERPVDPGHNERAWALNRRVEIVYTGERSS